MGSPTPKKCHFFDIFATPPGKSLPRRFLITFWWFWDPLDTPWGGSPKPSNFIIFGHFCTKMAKSAKFFKTQRESDHKYCQIRGWYPWGGSPDPPKVQNALIFCQKQGFLIKISGFGDPRPLGGSQNHQNGTFWDPTRDPPRGVSKWPPDDI